MLSEGAIVIVISALKGNNWVTNVLETFSMVEQRDMTPQDWVRLSKEEKAAYREFKEDADREAAQAEGGLWQLMGEQTASWLRRA